MIAFHSICAGLRSAACSVLFLTFALAAEAAEPGKFLRAGVDRIPDEYIVVFNDDVPAEQVPQHARDLTAAHDGQLFRTWNSGLKGAYVAMKEANALALSRNPHVKHVEENAVFHLASGSHRTYVDVKGCDPTTSICSPTPDNRLWHLDRADQNSASPTNAYSYKTSGTGVFVYVLDTGVNKYHQEFSPLGARILPGYNATAGVDESGNAISPDLMPADDPCMGFAVPPVPPYNTDFGAETGLYNKELYSNGHGTAVASAVAGNRTGVAKNAKIVPIKVMRCDRNSARHRVAGKKYAVNETMMRLNAPAPDNTILYRVKSVGNTGVTASTEPNWGKALGSLTVDGDVTWEVVEVSIKDDLNLAMIVEGLRWLKTQTDYPKTGSVLTMSMYRLATDQVGTMESLIRDIIAMGVTVTTSANNQNGNACDTSPASMSTSSSVITVGASMLKNRPWGGTGSSDVALPADGSGGPYVKGVEPTFNSSLAVKDVRWICGAGDSTPCLNASETSTKAPGTTDFQNFTGGSNGGPCVTLFAPGKNLYLALTGSADSYRDARQRKQYASGTSFSAPIAAGFAARILEANPSMTPAAVKMNLIANSAPELDEEGLNPIDFATGQPRSDTTNLLLRLSDVNIIAHPGSVAAEESAVTRLTVEASGTAALRYQWFAVNENFDLKLNRKNAFGALDPVPPGATFSSQPIPGATTTALDVPWSNTPRGYWVRVTNDYGSSDSQIAVVTPKPAAPRNLLVNEAVNSPGTVELTWAAADRAEQYRVERKIASEPWTAVTTLPSATRYYTETPWAPDRIVAYRIVSVAGSSHLPPGQVAESAPSNTDFANMRVYENLGTVIRAIHITELRAATNALAACFGRPPSFLDGELQPSLLQREIIAAHHFTRLMEKINEIRTSADIGISAASFQDSPDRFEAIERTDVVDLRNALE